MGTERATKAAPAEFRGRVYDSIIETIGAAPLVRIHRLAEDAGTNADILGKCEFSTRWPRSKTASASQ
jgi:cysteine synthase A